MIQVNMMALRNTDADPPVNKAKAHNIKMIGNVCRLLFFVNGIILNMNCNNK